MYPSNALIVACIFSSLMGQAIILTHFLCFLASRWLSSQHANSSSSFLHFLGSPFSLNHSSIRVCNPRGRIPHDTLDRSLCGRYQLYLIEQPSTGGVGFFGRRYVSPECGYNLRSGLDQSYDGGGSRYSIHDCGGEKRRADGPLAARRFCSRRS